MKVVYGHSKIRLTRSVVAIGIFDGLHRGHQYLLKKMLAKAKLLKVPSVVVTFFPHPVHVLRPDVKLGYLISLAHRFVLLQRLGVDYCYVVGFNKKFAHIEPGDFINDFLVGRLKAAAVYVGEDFRFGRDRMGDIHAFKKYARPCGYVAYPVKALTAHQEPISSTRLRQLVAAGDLKAAQQLLGRPFSVLGEVVRGSGRGHGLGFPTANVKFDNQVMPPHGVYAVRVMMDEVTFNGVANLGVRPTFKDKNRAAHLEVFIFDLAKAIYGRIIEVAFIRKIRDEQRFASTAALVAQIRRDEKAARRLLR